MSPEQFLQIYPKFANFNPVLLEELFQQAEDRCPASVWQNRQRTGIRLYLAHLCECEWRTSIATASGATAVAKGASASFSASPLDLESTPYGQQFAAELKLLPSISGFIV